LSKTKWRLVGVATFAVVVGLVVGLTIWLTGGSTKPGKLSHVAYARLWSRTSIGSPMDKVLGQWPKPYQIYPDSSRNHCFEWWDRPFILYNLCFNKGVLVTKSLG
jgi:hypothetical protein